MVISPSNYKNTFWQFNAHIQTIYPALMRRVEQLSCRYERINTPEHDFLEMDWYEQQSENLVILCHGLEGNSKRPYMLGMGNLFYINGFDILSWNYRGCGMEMNKTMQFYHSGAIEDLDFIISHALAKNRYHSITLIGFSLGGNLVLKYLGEKGKEIPHQITGAVALSVPLDLESSCYEIMKPHNFLYHYRFLRQLKEKVLKKSQTIPSILDHKPLVKIKTLYEFDNYYTAPIHGFIDAHDYYTKASSLSLLTTISKPTLIINAQNDTFLSDKCYPTEDLKNHSLVHLEIPQQGGHVGFYSDHHRGHYWSEIRTLEFIQKINGTDPIFE